jgi:hypothetical protein
MKPSRSRPASTKRPAQKRTSIAAAAVYSAGLVGETLATPDASSTAPAEVPATTTNRPVPKTAYAARVTSSV